MKSKLFGTMPDGREVTIYTIKNKQGMSISAINYGGIITSIRVPDKNGVIEDVVIGYDTLEGYLSDTNYIGAIVGRCANRIAGGSFLLDGKQYSLYKNEKNNTHHGGKIGFNKRWWNIQEKEWRDGTAMRLTYTSPDGEEGFPGKLGVEVLYILTNKNELIIKYKASSNKTTIVNLTNHSYFNLSGRQDETVDNQVLQIPTNYFLHLDDNLVPTGEFDSVEGTPLDFRTPKHICEGYDESHEQVAKASGIDHCFVVPTSKNYAIHYEDEKSGRILEITTGEPGIQVYSANFLTCSFLGKFKCTYRPHSAIAFEPQHFPDSIHHKNFPPIVLYKGQEYTAQTTYAFSVRNDDSKNNDN